MREAEMKLIAELIKNSHRSDRELAKATGLSQPTVSRLRIKLEKEGYIKEYTIIPNFKNLGYEIMAITFVKLKDALTSKQIEEARRIAKEELDKSPFGILLLERGLGLGYDGVVIAVYENYTRYVEHLKWFSMFEFLEMSKIESFIINLKDPIHYRSLTFRNLAGHILALGQHNK